jgi:hypothetical protein
MMKYTLSLLLSCMVTVAFSQFSTRQYDIPFTIDGQELANPLAGGLNTCQMSRVDVNLDGLEDLFFFDRQTTRISVFVNMNGAPGAIDYQYTLDYNSAFPLGLRNWVLMRDMNCDGKKDICTNTGSGLRIFWNISDTQLAFSAASTGAISATYDFGNGSVFDAGIFSIAPDVPAIADYENDGDLDVWSWNDNAAGLYFFENRASDNGDCSIPDFECRGRWYGMFNEGPDSFAILYGEDFNDDFDIVNPRSQRDGQHTGGTVLMIDLDQNGLKDIVASDVTENYMASLQLMNSSTGRDSVFQVLTDFPQPFGASSPVNMPIFPAGFYEDIDNDGIHDLIVCTNDDVNGSVDQQSVWYYKNNGLNDLPVFEFVQDDFLQEQMIDIGTSSAPVVFDVNQDGLLDILLANRRYYEEGNLNTAIIWYFENTGTLDAPAFVLVDDNWLDIPSYTWKSVYPSFYDLDGDNDMDLLMGELEGEIKHFENTAGPGNPCVFEYIGLLTDATNAVIDVGQYSKPQWFDLNGDGAVELIVGEKNGNINCYLNTGDNNTPVWTFESDTLGHAVASGFLGERYSSPHFYVNNLGDAELLLGSDQGNIMHFGDISIDGNFTLLNNAFDGIFEGFRCTPYMADLNGNAIPDLLLGNMAGGLGIYYDAISAIQETVASQPLVVYPNPADQRITVECPIQSVRASWQLFDLTGRLVLSGLIQQPTLQIDLHPMEDGIYILKAGDAPAARVCVSRR